MSRVIRVRPLTLQHNHLHVDRFLTIVEWAKLRYSVTFADGDYGYCTLIDGKPDPASIKIEEL